MKYLQSTPFSVGLGSKAYSVGWERTFGKKPACPACGGTGSTLPEGADAVVTCPACAGTGQALEAPEKLHFPCHQLASDDGTGWFCLCPHCEVRRREPGAPDECRRFDGCVCACGELPIP